MKADFIFATIMASVLNIWFLVKSLSIIIN